MKCRLFSISQISRGFKSFPTWHTFKWLFNSFVLLQNWAKLFRKWWKLDVSNWNGVMIKSFQCSCCYCILAVMLPHMIVSSVRVHLDNLQAYLKQVFHNVKGSWLILVQSVRRKLKRNKCRALFYQIIMTNIFMLANILMLATCRKKIQNGIKFDPEKHRVETHGPPPVCMKSPYCQRPLC